MNAESIEPTCVDVGSIQLVELFFYRFCILYLTKLYTIPSIKNAIILIDAISSIVLIYYFIYVDLDLCL